jgi:hypothetical protein
VVKFLCATGVTLCAFSDTFDESILLVKIEFGILNAQTNYYFSLYDEILQHCALSIKFSKITYMVSNNVTAHFIT